HVSAAVAEAGTPPAAVLFLAGSGAADTIEAVVDSVLRIGVRGADGRPAAGELVEVKPMPVAQYPYELEATFGFPGQPPYLYTAGWVYTNAAGVLELRVKLGRRAGGARISVVAPRLGVGDTARFTVRPGRATGVRSLPVDTTITTGTRAPLRLNTVDRWGNARDAEPVSLTVAAGPGRAEGSGVVGGDSIGQVTAVAAYGGWRDTTYVRVAPAGMVAVTGSADNTAQAAALYTLPLDASTVKRVRTTIVGSGYFGSMDVAWLGRDRLVYHDNRLNHGKLVYTLDLGTGAWGRLLPAADQMEMEYLPRASRDGAWVYFSAGPATWSYHLYRARPDGTGLERLSSATPAAQYEWGPDPSPDGTRVVFSKDGAAAVDEVHLMTIATRQTRALNLRGTSPRWSPDGSRIALLGRRDATEPVRLLLVAPDGSDARTLSTTILYGNIDWTPDGRYLVGSTGGNRLVIIEVATGKELLVPVAGIEGGMLFGGARP
ncbi:MAG TPA: hypothetical protein VFQ39_09990, partial [Longimicrobium sp.]|nr:hypothetical protein [Longimicrobium sp.]